MHMGFQKWWTESDRYGGWVAIESKIDGRNIVVSRYPVWSHVWEVRPGTARRFVLSRPYSESPW